MTKTMTKTIPEMHEYTFYERDDDGAMLFEVECELDCRLAIHDGPEFVCDGVYLGRSVLKDRVWKDAGRVNILTSPVKHLHDLAVRIIAQAEADQSLLDDLAQDEGYYWHTRGPNDPDAGYRRAF